MPDKIVKDTYHKEEIHVVKSQVLQALLQTKFDTRGVSGPDLGDDKDVLTLDARSNSLLDTLSNGLLVSVAVGAIDQPVAVLQGIRYSMFDFLMLTLPCALPFVSVGCIWFRRSHAGHGDSPSPKAGISRPLFSWKLWLAIV